MAGGTQGGGEEGTSGGLHVYSGSLPVTLSDDQERLPMQTFCRKCPLPTNALDWGVKWGQVTGI